jgi:hypothetical protein
LAAGSGPEQARTATAGAIHGQPFLAAGIEPESIKIKAWLKQSIRHPPVIGGHQGPAPNQSRIGSAISGS